MKKYLVPLSAAGVAVVFFLGYYAGSGRTPSQQQEQVMPSGAPEGAEEHIENKRQNVSAIQEESAEKTESHLAKRAVPSAPAAAEAEKTLPDLKRQARAELIASLRKQGVPERDVERVANTLSMLTGGGIVLSPRAEVQPELTVQQREDVTASVRAEGVPEEDAERVAKTLGAAALSSDQQRGLSNSSYEEKKSEAAASARAAGVAEEDVDRVATTLADAVPQDAASEQPDDEDQAEKKAEVAAKVRDAGVPEQDVERVTNTLTDAGASPTQKNSQDK